MKKLLLIFTLLLILTGCSNTELNNFFNKIETSNYILTITVNDNDINILEVNNDTAYAYNLKADSKSEEVYFTNLDTTYKTYIYSNEQWKTTTSSSYYNNYFGLIQIKDQKFTKENDYYTFTYDIGTFNIYPEDSKAMLTNTVTNEYVVYQYNFKEAPIITLPF
ncbi:MAG: lipoprotein [bacterium]